MKLFGLLITKDDDEVFADWCKNQLAFYDAVVCLDGSVSDATARLAKPHGDIIYLHENDCQIPSKTDHGLRAVAHQEIVRRFGLDNWIMCCHADEFCYHDPRKIVDKAVREGYDQVAWYSLQFYPHPSEQADWDPRHKLPVQERSRFFHWGYRGSGLPWLEDRLYRNSAQVHWDGRTHGNVRPHHLERPAPFHPILQHYKVFTLDMASYEANRGSTYYRNHWQGLEHRTGLAFSVQKPEELFVASIPHYQHCDRFEGSIRQGWNMGDEFRPSPTNLLAPLR